jgi:hypothetical protein
MRVVVQANLFSPVVAYDTNAASSPPSGFKKMILDFLNPVVQVQSDDGRAIYKTGEFYNATGQFYLLGFAAVIAVGTVILVANNSRKNKNAIR